MWIQIQIVYTYGPWKAIHHPPAHLHATMKIQGLSPDSALLTFGPTMLGAWWCNGDLILIYWAKWPSNGNSMVIYIVVKSNHQFHNETQISEITNANVQNMATDVLKVEHTNGQMTDTALIIIHLLVVEWFLSFYFVDQWEKGGIPISNWICCFLFVFKGYIQYKRWLCARYWTTS